MAKTFQQLVQEVEGFDSKRTRQFYAIHKYKEHPSDSEDPKNFEINTKKDTSKDHVTTSRGNPEMPTVKEEDEIRHSEKPLSDWTDAQLLKRLKKFNHPGYAKSYESMLPYLMDEINKRGLDPQPHDEFSRYSDEKLAKRIATGSKPGYSKVYDGQLKAANAEANRRKQIKEAIARGEQVSYETWERMVKDSDEIECGRCWGSHECDCGEFDGK